MNLLSGSITIRDRKVPILWTGEMAQHVASNYLNRYDSHPILHIEIQQLASKVKIWAKISPRSYYGYGVNYGINFVVYIVLHTNFAEIRTAYKRKEFEMDKDEIAGLAEQLFEESVYEEMVDDGYHNSVEEAKEHHARSYYKEFILPFKNKKKKKK